MKKLTLTLCLCIMVLTCALAQRLTINGKHFYKHGKKTFLNGINTPWQNDPYYRIDFIDTDHFKLQYWKDEFRKMQANKVNCVRIWVHGRGNNTPRYDTNGFVLAPSSRFYNHLDAVLNEAKKRNIHVILTMWSFDMVLKAGNGQPGSTQYQKHRNVIKDYNKLTSYINNFLAPVVNRYKGNPYLIGYDIINEPEHIWENHQNLVDGQINRSQAVRFVAACAVTIHEASAYKSFTTVGSKWIIYNSKRFNSWGAAHAGDNWSNQALKAQYGGHSAAYLDFYSMHWYQWQSTGAPFSEKATALYPSVTKPIVITEFPGTDLPNNTCNCTCSGPNCNFNVQLKHVYNKVKTNGFAGITAWRNGNEDDNFGKSAKIYEATRSFANNFPDLVYPPAGSSRTNMGLINSSSQQTDLLVYPNPSNDGHFYLAIEFDQQTTLSIQVYNNLGQIVWQKPSTPFPLGKHTIGLDLRKANVSRGSYILKISTNNGNKMARIVH